MCYLEKEKTAVESTERGMGYSSLPAPKDHHKGDSDKYSPCPLAIELEEDSLSCSKEDLAWLPGESFFPQGY